MSRARYAKVLPTGEPTPAELFFSRRSFIQVTAGLSLAGAAMAPGCGSSSAPPQATATGPDPRIVPPIQWPEGMKITRAAEPALPAPIAAARAEPTSRLLAASHNNFYEFLPGEAGDVWPATKDFTIEPWTVAITGECSKPQTLGLDELFKMPHEERLYHFRCVERWAMNVPWVGIPLRRLLERAEPNSHARFVRFTSAHQPDRMPGAQPKSPYPWPYVEGLRMDEAMNELAMAVTGVYGEPLPKQHGAPIRIIVPWKYGYKNPKSIVKIEFLREEPGTFWQVQPHEYGFLSNVNPNIPHPRWSQAQSWWVGSRDRTFPTPIFNGYGEFVADLYPDEPTTPQAPLRKGQIAR